MHPEVEKLLALQKVDQQIARIRKDLVSLPKERERREKKLAGIKSRLDEALARQQAAELAARNNEVSIKQSDGELKKLEERLNTVKNNAEYQATLLHIESVKGDRGQLEEEGLGLLESVETSKQDVGVVQAEYDDASAVHAKFLEEAQALTEERERQVAVVAQGRDEQVAAIQPDLYRTYDRMFDARGSMAVAEVIDGVCQGCYSSIPPNLQVKLQAGSSIVTCDSCQRILYTQ